MGVHLVHVPIDRREADPGNANGAAEPATDGNPGAEPPPLTKVGSFTSLRAGGDGDGGAGGAGDDLGHPPADGGPKTEEKPAAGWGAAPAMAPLHMPSVATVAVKKKHKVAARPVTYQVRIERPGAAVYDASAFNHAVRCTYLPPKNYCTAGHVRGPADERLVWLDVRQSVSPGVHPDHEEHLLSGPW